MSLMAVNLRKRGFVLAGEDTGDLRITVPAEKRKRMSKAEYLKTRSKQAKLKDKAAAFSDLMRAIESEMGANEMLIAIYEMFSNVASDGEDEWVEEVEDDDESESKS